MRYQGSKLKIAKHFLPIITKDLYGTDRIFVDLFAGGMNVVDKIDHPIKVANDLNPYVIALWRDIQVNGDKNIPSSVSEEEYNRAKQQVLYKNRENNFTYVQLGFIGACCSHGSGWFNGYAHYNQKKKEDHIKEARSGLCKQIDKFKHLDKTRFMCNDYREVIYRFKPEEINRMVIYCDPPYANTKKYETDFDNNAFWDWVREMGRMYPGCKIYISEYNAPSDFTCIWSKDVPDGMGTTKKGEKQNRKIEKLFVHNKLAKEIHL